MGRLLRTAASLAAATMIAATAASSATAAPYPTGRPGHGCPSGAVCVYPTSTTFNTGPETHGKYYSYGYHNLHDQIGTHLVYDNQYSVGGANAGATFCGEYDGRGGPSLALTHTGAWTDMKLTYINSITLWLYESAYTREIDCEM